MSKKAKLSNEIKEDDILFNGLTKKEIFDRILQLRNYMPYIEDNIEKLQKSIAKKSDVLKREERVLIHYESQLNELLDVYFSQKTHK